MFIKVNRKVSALFIFAILAIPIAAQTPTLKDQVAKGTSPDAWLNGLRKANGDRWSEESEVSAPMAEILRAANDVIAEQSKAGTDCRRAAAGVGFGITYDAYATVGLNGLLSALSEATRSAFWQFYFEKWIPIAKDGIKTGESFILKFKDLLKESSKKADEYLKEQLARGKAEVYVSKVSQGTCQAILVAIWDRAAGTYEVLIYGDCKCTPQTTWTERGSARLGTFAIQVKGQITVGVDFRKEMPVVNVSTPNAVSVEANCEKCKKDGEETGTSTPPPAPQEVDPCTLKPPCAECQTIYDAIVAGCKRISEIDTEQRQARAFSQGREDTAKYVRNEIAKLQQQAASPDRIKAKQDELKEIQREARKIELDDYARGLERRETGKRMQGLAQQLKECVKTRCDSKPGPIPTGPTGTDKFDRCVAGTWRSESVFSSFNHWDNGGEGVILMVDGNGQAVIDYKDATANTDKGQTRTWAGSAAGRLSANNGILNITTLDREETTITFASQYGTHKGDMKGLGNLLQAGLTYRYTCDATTLTLKGTVFSSTFKRFGTLPR